MKMTSKYYNSIRFLILFSYDIVATTLSLYLGCFFIFPKTTYLEWFLYLFIGLFFPILMLVRSSSLFIFKCYHHLWRFASSRQFLTILKALALSSLITYVLLFLFSLFHGPFQQFQTTVINSSDLKKLMILEPILSVVFILGFRYFLRLLRDNVTHQNLSKNAQNLSKKSLIIGAGYTGEMVCREMLRNPKNKDQIIGFIDDDDNKLGRFIHGIKVLGRVKELIDIVHANDINEVIIAISNVSRYEIKAIIDTCQRNEIKYKITPDIYSILSGKVSMSQIREVKIEDLLGRNVNNLPTQHIENFFQDKVVLITGGGGSIGSEICRQCQCNNPKQIIILDIDENAVHDIYLELTQNSAYHAEIIPVVLDYSHKDRLESLFQLYNIDIVFHAAAHKHVPLMEKNVGQVVRNNIFGTLTLVAIAKQFTISEFVFISSDKAIRPTSCMGATKRLCEVIIQLYAQKSKTKFTAVRFGNVLGSQGSVIPYFKQQIETGGPVTVTHPEMTRYFMTIPEAVSLVLQTALKSQGGEIFILDMGEPIKIVDLAKDLIQLSGLTLGTDIDIQYIGLRPGEKLFEELYFDKKVLKNTDHKKIFIAKPTVFNETLVYEHLEKLKKPTDDETLRKMLISICKQLDYISDNTDVGVVHQNSI